MPHQEWNEGDIKMKKGQRELGISISWFQEDFEFDKGASIPMPTFHLDGLLSTCLRCWGT